MRYNGEESQKAIETVGKDPLGGDGKRLCQAVGR